MYKRQALDKHIADLKKEVAALENIFEEIRSNKIYLGAFEWRMAVSYTHLDVYKRQIVYNASLSNFIASS